MLFLLFAQAVAAHFTLTGPVPLGFSDDVQLISPCGGFPIMISNMSIASQDLQVDDFAVNLFTSRTPAKWLFRATMNHEAPFNWSPALPVVNTDGIGSLCVPNLSVPEEFKGQTGVLQVIQETTDLAYQVCNEAMPNDSTYLLRISTDIHYQCAIVRFANGTDDEVSDNQPPCYTEDNLTIEVTEEAELRIPTVTSAGASSTIAAGGMEEMNMNAAATTATTSIANNTTTAMPKPLMASSGARRNRPLFWI